MHVSFFLFNLCKWSLCKMRDPGNEVEKHLLFGHRSLNPLTPGPFCKKVHFWTFWRFSGWISEKLALILSKMHLQHDRLPFLPPASRFSAWWLGNVQKSKFWDEKKVTYVLRLFDFWIFFFRLSFFSFSFLFAVVIDLLLGLLGVKKLLRKCHRDGQFLPWSS